MHSGTELKSQAERELTLGEFRSLVKTCNKKTKKMKEEKDSGGTEAAEATSVMVATNVASCGLDLPAMSLVDYYYHYHYYYYYYY